MGTELPGDLSPAMRQQFFEPVHGVVGDTPEHVAEPGERIDLHGPPRSLAATAPSHCYQSTDRRTGSSIGSFLRSPLIWLPSPTKAARHTAKCSNSFIDERPSDRTQSGKPTTRRWIFCCSGQTGKLGSRGYRSSSTTTAARSPGTFRPSKIHAPSIRRSPCARQSGVRKIPGGPYVASPTFCIPTMAASAAGTGCGRRCERRGDNA
jgi:hypothetical protein